MAVSKLLPSGGANDFNLNITGATTVASFDKEYSSGSYSIVSSGNDATIDIYAYNAAGTLVGYTGTKAFTASAGFNKMVILGGSIGDVLGFTYKKTITTTAATAEVTAGPVAISLTPSSLPSINDTLTLTGANLASNVTVTFSSTTGVYTSTAAKNIVRSNSTSLIVTRPDNLPVANSPYTITLSNPGVISPTGSNSHILANSVTAGTNPAWTTNATLPGYFLNTAYSTTLLATDTEATDIDYSIVSGSLPSGFSLDGETGVITGTTTSTAGGSFTVRAVDTGGNFLDRAFTLSLIGPNAPVWVTAAGSLANATTVSAYSVQLSATDDSGNAPVYSLVSGTLPTGLTLSTSGLISGTATAGNGNVDFTVRATDQNGYFTNRVFKIGIEVTFNVGVFFGGGNGDSGHWSDANMGSTFQPSFSGTITRIRGLNNNSAGNLGINGLKIGVASSLNNPSVTASNLPTISANRSYYGGSIPFSGGTKSGNICDFQNINYPITAGTVYAINFTGSDQQFWAVNNFSYTSTGGTQAGVWSTGNNTNWGSGGNGSYAHAMGITYIALT